MATPGSEGALFETLSYAIPLPPSAPSSLHAPGLKCRGMPIPTTQMCQGIAPPHTPKLEMPWHTSAATPSPSPPPRRSDDQLKRQTTKGLDRPPASPNLHRHAREAYPHARPPAPFSRSSPADAFGPWPQTLNTLPPTRPHSPTHCPLPPPPTVLPHALPTPLHPLPLPNLLTSPSPTQPALPSHVSLSNVSRRSCTWNASA